MPGGIFNVSTAVRGQVAGSYFAGRRRAIPVKKIIMSSAFVKESSDQQWLHEVEGTVAALKQYLTRENGTRIFEQRSFTDPKRNQEVHVMSNGLSYALDADGRWYVVL